MSGRWVDLPTAAELLGITTEAARKRAARGSLESDKRGDGRVVVWVGDDRTEGGREGQVEGDGLLVEVLREEVAHLRRESERKDTIIMTLSQANAEMSRTVRALEAGTDTPAPPEAREEPAQADANGAADARPSTGGSGAQNGAERSWWRRVFGGLSVVLAALLACVLGYFLGLRQRRFERLEERRAEVLAELSGLLFEVEDRYRKWYAPSLRTPEAWHSADEIRGKVAERAQAVVESVNALTRCYHRNIAWLDPDVAARINDAKDELHEMLFEYGKLGAANTYFQVSEEGVEAAKRMGERIPKIRAELVDEFRGIVRPIIAWSVLRALVTTPSGQRELPAQDSREER